MESVFSPDVMAGLQKARMNDAMKKNRLRVHVDDDIRPILLLWEDGFSMIAGSAPNLRGFVDIYDGSKHLLQCLVIRSELDGDVLNYEFKRWTRAMDTPPKDFAEDENAPVALIGRR